MITVALQTTNSRMYLSRLDPIQFDNHQEKVTFPNDNEAEYAIVNRLLSFVRYISLHPKYSPVGVYIDHIEEGNIAHSIQIL